RGCARAHPVATVCRLVHERTHQGGRDDHAHPAARGDQPRLRPHACGRQHPQRGALRRGGTAMIRFYYGSGSPFSWRVQLALEEQGLAYEPVLLSFEKGEHKSPELLARSPPGQVPALEG